MTRPGPSTPLTITATVVNIADPDHPTQVSGVDGNPTSYNSPSRPAGYPSGMIVGQGWSSTSGISRSVRFW